MNKIEVSVPNVYLSDLEKLAERVRKVAGETNAEISFEFIIASLFPTSWKNIQNDLNCQYTKGYIQGYADKEAELKSFTRTVSEDDDPDCYCE
jgi:hypothetical protein